MSTRRIRPAVSLVATALVGLAACEQDTSGLTGHDHDHLAPSLNMMIQNESRPEVRAQLVELKRFTAAFHNIDHALAEGYDFNIGCIDETLVGLDPSVARGMGYHVTKSGVDLVGDPAVNLLEPEFLVYAPSPQDASLPEGERVRAAKLVGFDYFVLGGPLGENDPNPPTLFGDRFNWSPGFGGWMRHIYLWGGGNPDGLYEDFNPRVRLCTQLLAGEPIE